MTCPVGPPIAQDGRVIARGRVVAESARTDGQGRYELECLAAGALRIRFAQQPGWSGQPIDDGRVVDIVLGRYHHGVDFEVPRRKSR